MTATIVHCRAICLALLMSATCLNSQTRKSLGMAYLYTGLFYFQDYHRAFLRSSVNVVAGSLLLAGTGTMVGNLFGTGENSTGLHVLGWMGMAAGGLGLLGNSILGIGDIPKARERFLAKLKPSLSYERNRDGKKVSAIRLEFGLL